MVYRKAEILNRKEQYSSNDRLDKNDSVSQEMGNPNYQ